MNELIPDGPKKKYLGQYIGQVVSVSDPDSLMRVKVRVHPSFAGVPVERLPWAEYMLPIGSRPGNGIFAPVKVGDWVWVDFPFDGDSRRPRVVGSVHYCPSQAPNLPHEAWAGPTRYSHQRTGQEPAPSPPTYHDGSIVLDENGVLLEVGADGAIRATNKASGSVIEICADGTITIHGAGAVNVSAATDAHIIVGGDADITVDGDVEIGCQNASVTAEGDASINGESVDIVGSASITIAAPAIQINGPLGANAGSGGAMALTGNLNVTGNISATGTITDTEGNTNNHSH
ncbi:MAG: phage baseplate assembly protein V [Pseudomonadota bacterium]